MEVKTGKYKGWFTIKDVAIAVDRIPRTIKDWEKKGLITKAKRDSRNIRVYRKEDIEEIKKLVKKTKYFSSSDNLSLPPKKEG